MRRRKFLVAALILALVAVEGCVRRTAINDAKTRDPVAFEWNFAGVCATDWPGAFDFYTRSLGVRARSQDGHWAIFGAGWEHYRAGQSRGLVFELFEGKSIGAGANHEQAILLGMQVRDLERTIARASGRGVRFITPITIEDGHQRIEFIASDGLRWILQSAPGARARDELSDPEITLAELKVYDLQHQTRFYRDVLGMRSVEQQASRVILQQAADGPRLLLKLGGHKHSVDPAWADRPALGQPIFLSFMTRDIRAAAARLESAGVKTLHAIEQHDWGGTDLIVADSDGNAVQIVQFDNPFSYGSQRPR